MSSSTEFTWDSNDFDHLLRSCQFDDSVKLSLRYLTRTDLEILEAGCGSGRVVKYLYDLGYQKIYGIELNQDAVNYINAKFPELNIIQGDLLSMPYGNDKFDRILSYGVVEHFPKGLDDPLQSIYNALKPGGIAIVTVPSYNTLRVFKGLLGRSVELLNPMQKNYIRTKLKRELRPKRNKGSCSYYMHPQHGNFFEYRLTKRQFEQACKNAGFEIIESSPICQIDGLYHLFGSHFVVFENWEFKVSRVGQVVNQVMTTIPFLHNHMHACVLKKDAY
jgi:SAM-dependent methyltransferase